MRRRRSPPSAASPDVGAARRAAANARRALLGAALAGAALGAGAAFAAEPALTITMQNAGFVPAQATVAAGTRITWTNKDDIPHSATADDKRFDSGAILPGKTFTWTADRAGAVPYHCIFHPSMTATLNVRSGSAKQTPP